VPTEGITQNTGFSYVKADEIMTNGENSGASLNGIHYFKNSCRKKLKKQEDRTVNRTSIIQNKQR